MKTMKIVVAVIAVLIIVGIGTLFLDNNSLSNETNHGTHVTSYKAVMGKISLTQDFPEKQESAPVFRVIPLKNDIIKVKVKQVANIRPNVTSEKDAPAAALKILDSYGGLPKDAVLRSSETSYLKRFNRTTQQDEIVIPVETTVTYRRQLDGMPVLWGGYIEVTLGENGELLELRKVWRTVEPAGTARVIPASVAFEKLLQGNDLDRTKGPYDVTIDRIRLGYYENPNNVSQEYLEPVWFFQGSMKENSNMTFFVYARQFAAFDQSPTVTKKSVAGKKVSEKDPFTATFTDTSDASPTKWQWDFGDGTTSIEQNPIHKYKTPGTYNVTLTVWNDMGSDTLTQQYIVDDTPAKTVDANGIADTTDSVATINETTVTAAPSSTETVLETSEATIIPTATVTTGTTITVNETIVSPIPTDAVSATPTLLLNATQNITSDNSTAS